MIEWNPENIYLLKFNNRNTGKKCEICSKLTIKTPERRRQRHHSSIFIINFEHISHLFLMFLLLTLSKVFCTKVGTKPSIICFRN